jgi:hypothetical protein
MIRLASIFGGTSTYRGILQKEVDSLIGFFCLRPVDYPELIEYRLKGYVWYARENHHTLDY